MKKIEIVKAKGFEIKPKGKYLIILDRADAGHQNDLVEFNERLSELFGKTKVLAIFLKDMNNVKIAELIEGVSKDEKK